MTFPVIGLLGPAGSGKDAVADWFVKEHQFVKVAFSDPIKRFAKIVFGFTTEQLWGPSEMRNAPIPAGDAYWAQCRLRFGDAFKPFIHDLFPPDNGNPNSQRVRALQLLMRWHGVLEQVSRKGMEKTLEAGTITPRIVLQTLGTEWGRQLDENVWSRYLFEKIVPTISTHLALLYSSSEGIIPYLANVATGGPAYKGVVIPDLRFRNEVLFTKEHGGQVLKLERPGRPGATVGIPGHASEVEQETIDPSLYRYVVCPEGLENLYQTLRMWAGLCL